MSTPYLTGKIWSRIHTAHARACYSQIFICPVDGGARNLEVQIIEVLLYWCISVPKVKNKDGYVTTCIA